MPLAWLAGRPSCDLPKNAGKWGWVPAQLAVTAVGMWVGGASPWPDCEAWQQLLWVRESPYQLQGPAKMQGHWGMTPVDSSSERGFQNGIHQY